LRTSMTVGRKGVAETGKMGRNLVVSELETSEILTDRGMDYEEGRVASRDGKKELGWSSRE
jgi:hypothetical protein